MGTDNDLHPNSPAFKAGACGFKSAAPLGTNPDMDKWARPGPLGAIQFGVNTPVASSLPAFLIDVHGIVIHPRVTPAITSTIERGSMPKVRGLIVHQTGGATAQSSLDSYKSTGANGAHFLIDKDGTIYQTASVYKRTWHVGKLKARCLLQTTCTPTEINAYRRFNPTAMNKREAAKAVPGRFPSNEDAVGIELVGATVTGNPPKLVIRPCRSKKDEV